MAVEKTTLKIKAERLGTISQVKELLTDLDNTYNSIYAFDFLVDTLRYEWERRRRQRSDRFHKLRKDWETKRPSPFEPLFFDYYWDEYFSQLEILPNLLDLQSKLNIEKVVLPSDRLQLSRINIQSPGFWEVVGSLNPLQQIREYLKDKHERNKDRNYRSRQEEELADIEILEKKNNIINQRIAILKELGYSETEIRQLVMAMVIEPLNKLGKHQENGLIEEPDN